MPSTICLAKSPSAVSGLGPGKGSANTAPAGWRMTSAMSHRVDTAHLPLSFVRYSVHFANRVDSHLIELDLGDYSSLRRCLVIEIDAVEVAMLFCGRRWQEVALTVGYPQ